MADQFISGLPEAATPAASDVIPVVSGGSTKKLQLQNIRSALPVATTLEKGLLSAQDKQSLAEMLADIAELQGRPYVATVASASVISVPDGVNILILTGSTSIASVVGAKDYNTYTFYYPTGPGLDLLGVAMTAGQVLVAVYTP